MRGVVLRSAAPASCPISYPSSYSRSFPVSSLKIFLASFLATCLICSLMAVPAQARKLEQRTSIQEVRELYENVNRTRASEVNARENDAIIRQRLECYAEYADYTPRLRVCNNAYVKELVSQAREKVRSRPDLGWFVVNINLCPVMYNLCTGQTQNDRERCILFERQCVDYTLDRFWRGAAQYTHQQYRSE